MLVYFRDGSAQASVRAVTLRYKLQIKLSTSHTRRYLWLRGKASASRAADLGSIHHGSLSRSSHTGDCKKVLLSGAWRYRVRAGWDWFGWC